jgi:hypothetical protein
MNRLVSIIFFLLTIPISGFSQDGIALEVEQYSINGMPGVQSYAQGQWDGKWVIIGGRTDGLHRRQPVFAFQSAGNNDQVYVIDPNSGQVWSQALTGLPTRVVEQLQSTNMNFEQRDSILYIVGGYAFSPSANDHTTFPYLTAVNMAGLVRDIPNGTLPSAHFRQIQDNRFQVTGGYMGLLDTTFYLAGGQKFIGRYNPMGPTHGPGFTQEYTEEIRRFSIEDDGVNWSVNWLPAWRDTNNLHRRDYNMAMQIFPNGERGFTMFSGVFQKNVDLPWLNSVDFTASGYTVRNDFDQLLNQYHTAHLSIYNGNSQQMHTVFFGGIGRYFIDSATGQLTDDQDVPFVKTISMMSRYPNDSVREFHFQETMPGFLGSGAEFIPVDESFYDDGILRWENLPVGKTLVGYIVGGIESSAPNIFWVDDGTMSEASNKVFKVYANNTQTSIGTDILRDEQVFGLNISPNPNIGQMHVELKVVYPSTADIAIYDLKGSMVRKLDQVQTPIDSTLDYDLSELASGTYFLRVDVGQYHRELQFIKQ